VNAELNGDQLAAMNLDSEEEELAVRLISWYLKIGAVMVSEEEYERRVEICRGCDRWGTVELPGLSGVVRVAGCEECGCPTSTKPRVDRFFNPKTLKREEVKCPLGKWENEELKFE